MAEKDISEKILESYNDVFADIINVLLFDGKEVIKPDELEDAQARSAYKEDGKYRDIERDVSKRWKKNQICLSCIGIENQSVTDADMPLRIMAYDAAEYRAQLNNKPTSGHRYPVLTVVLYFGLTGTWEKTLSLHSRLTIPKEFKPFVNDYKINVFSIANLSKEKVDLFKSDFKVVADYFVQMKQTGTYTGSKQDLVHVQEVLSLLAIMTKDHRFEDVFNEERTEEKEIKTMSDALTRIEERGIQKGIQKGRSEGLTAGRINTLIDLVTSGLLSIKDAAKFAEMSESEFEKILKK